MTNSFRILLPFLLIALLHAESSEGKKVSLSFVALNTITSKPLYLTLGKKTQELELLSGRRSFPIEVVVKDITILTNSTDPEQDYKLLGKSPLVSGTSQMLYFLREKSDGTLQLYGLDDSNQAFPEGSYRFVNFMQQPLLVDFNKKKIGVKSGQDKVAKLNLPENGEFTPFVIYNREGEILAGTRLFSHAKNREMVLIFPPKKGRQRLDLRFFSD